MDGANNVASTSDGTTTCTRTYNPANQLTTETCSGSTETFVYDANGNLASDDDYVYHWDFLNRLVHVEAKVGGDTEPLVAFGYDAAGRRITKVFNDNVDLGILGTQPARSESWFTYSGPNVVQESQPIRWSADPSGGVFDPSVNVVRQFTYGSGVDEVLEMTVDSNADGDTTDASDERYYYAFDTQGSVIGLIDDNGGLVEGYSYNPHGELTIRVPGSGNSDVKWDGNDTVLTSPARSPAGNPFHYTGQRLDPETQTYHYRARQYDPEQGRFLSRDPIGIWTDDLNLGNPYAYVGNRPWQFRDPSGMFLETIWDAANVVYGAVSLGKNIAQGNWEQAAWDAGGLVVDVAATLVPFVPGGAATVLKVGRHADKVGDLARAAEKTRDATRFVDDLGKAATKNADEFKDATKWVEHGGRRTTTIGNSADLPANVARSGNGGSRVMHVPESIWNDGMSHAQKWNLNKKFLDNTIKRQDDIQLATAPWRQNLVPLFQKELKYLGDRGVTTTYDGIKWFSAGRSAL